MIRSLVRWQLVATVTVLCTIMLGGWSAWGQEQLPWEQPPQSRQGPTYGSDHGGDNGGPMGSSQSVQDDYIRPDDRPNPGSYGSRPTGDMPYGTDQVQTPGGYTTNEYGIPYRDSSGEPPASYSRTDPYGNTPPVGGYSYGSRPPRYDERYASPYQPPPRDTRTFSQNEIIAAGHGFFGSLSKGLASVIEYSFKHSGRPNGYILGEDAGGAFVAGLRYGEGVLYTKDAGSHRIFWQGPSIGYDFGAEGSKVMVLVYNLRDPQEIYERFGGVQGAAYVVGGAGIQFLKRDHVTVAPIRAGLGLRLGANVGYLKYTRRPTWNPF